jgi:hypothetical protein
LVAKVYLVAQTVQTRMQQTINLPPPVDPNAPDKANLEIIRAEEVKSVAKRQQKLKEALKKGFAKVYNQWLQEVQDKLESSDNWETTQRQQSLHELIQKIEWICVGFNDHTQEVFNRVQSLKMLFLYTQGEKETVEEYARNLRSQWDTAEAFGGLPGVHKGLVEGLIRMPGQVVGPNNVTEDELGAVEAEVSEAIKGALLISGTNKRCYGKLKDKLANSYLLGSDQYPDPFNKATRILGNYQTMLRPALPYKPSSNDTGVAFLQRGG